MLRNRKERVREAKKRDKAVPERVSALLAASPVSGIVCPALNYSSDCASNSTKEYVRLMVFDPKTRPPLRSGGRHQTSVDFGKRFRLKNVVLQVDVDVRKRVVLKILPEKGVLVPRDFRPDGRTATPVGGPWC